MDSLINRSEDSKQRTEMSDDSSMDIPDTPDTLLESVDTSDVCYLCVHYSEGKCGSTLYQSNSHTIQTISELEDNDLDSLETLLIQTEPNHVIISSKSDPKLIQLLKSCSKQINEESTTGTTETSDNVSSESADNKSLTTNSDLLWKIELNFELHIVSHTLFGFENAKNRILSINSINNSDLNSETKKVLFFSSFFDFSDNNLFKSFGALLRFLDFNCIGIQLQTNDSTVEISSISRLYLQRLVTIERNSYESLQIFQQEWHPSSKKQGINQKEGLSLYGLFNCCVSKIGSNYLRKLFLLPTQEIDIIMDRLTAIEFFIEPLNHVLRDNLRQHLRQVKSVTALFNRFHSSATITINEMQVLSNNLTNALKIRDLITGQNNCLQVFQKIKHVFNEDMDRLFRVIHTVVDFDKSIRSQSFEINVGVDEELDQTKYVFTHLNLLLDEMAKQEIETFGQFIRQCNCVYIPQIGFLTSGQIIEGETPPHESVNGLQFVVSVGDRIYYKTQRTQEMDLRLGDIQSEIIDRQIAIINNLMELILEKKYLFVDIVKCCAKLDALIAMSRTALTYGYTKPNLTNDGIIEIIDGKHPLVEHMAQAFITNDYRSGGQHKKVKLISGPNACGKSVYLKQISLIVYMAHIGSYVPALKANIPILDRIFTRIHTPESISLRLSTFMLDLRQMSNATKYATKRSLVVVDEFGKGTQPIDGIALMAAFIDHWLTTTTPHLVVSSHFRCLPSIINKNQLIDCQTFQFMRTTDEMIYLFKLIDGHFKESIASQIAYLAKIPNNIIERGLQLCQIMANNMTIECKINETQKRKYKLYEEMAKKFLEFNITTDENIENFFQTNFSDRSISFTEE